VMLAERVVALTGAAGLLGTQYTRALADAGYAVATADDLSANPDVVVKPWGRIEGVLRIGRSPGTNQMVNIGIWGSSETYEWTIVAHGMSVRTDAEGRFVFPRVAPGDVWLTRSVAVLLHYIVRRCQPPGVPATAVTG